MSLPRHLLIEWPVARSERIGKGERESRRRDFASRIGAIQACCPEER